MKVVSRYEAEDGSIWSNADACKERDSLLAEVAGLLADFPPDPNLDSDHYLQHVPSKVLALQSGVARLALGVYPGDRHIDYVVRADKPAGRTFFGRILSDTDRLAPLNKAWHRIMCIDEQWREWQQPYYANHPPVGATDLRDEGHRK